MGENIYMLPSDMNLNIRCGTVGYNNKILVSDGKFSLGKNDEVNALTKISHNVETATHNVVAQKPTITHKDEKISLILFLAGGFTIWNISQ